MSLKWVYITGPGRSGTTILGELVNAHPNAAILHEFYLGKVLQPLGQLSSVIELSNRYAEFDTMLAEFISNTSSSKSTNASESEDGTVLEQSVLEKLAAADVFYQERSSIPDPIWTASTRRHPRIFPDLAKAYFQLLAPHKDIQLVGDKMPINNEADVKSLEPLFTQVPELRILAIVRNPLDTINSSRQRAHRTVLGRDAWPYLELQSAIDVWIGAWNALHKLSQLYGNSFHLVKYEALCADATKTWDEICAFLTLPRTPMSWHLKPLPDDLARAFLNNTDIETIRKQLGVVIDTWDRVEGPALFTQVPEIYPFLEFNQKEQLTRPEVSKYLGEGFSAPDPIGTWTDGPRAMISLQHRVTSRPILLEVWISLAILDDDRLCLFQVEINNAEPTLMEVSSVPKRVQLIVPASPLDAMGRFRVTFHILRPRGQDSGPEKRALGLCLEAFRLTEL